MHLPPDIQHEVILRPTAFAMLCLLLVKNLLKVRIKLQWNCDTLIGQTRIVKSGGQEPDRRADNSGWSSKAVEYWAMVASNYAHALGTSDMKLVPLQGHEHSLHEMMEEHAVIDLWRWKLLCMFLCFQAIYFLCCQEVWSCHAKRGRSLDLHRSFYDYSIVWQSGMDPKTYWNIVPKGFIHVALLQFPLVKHLSLKTTSAFFLQGWSWISSKTVRQIGFSQRSTWKHSEWRCLRWDIGYQQSLCFDIFNGSGLLWADPTGEGAWGKNHTESWQRYLTLDASVSWWLGFRSREPDSGGKDRTKNATFQHFVRQIKLPMQRGYSNQRSCWVAEPFGGCYTKFPSISTAFFPQTSTCTTFGTAQWSIQQQHFCTW